jgi:cell division protein FtsW
LTDQTQPRIGWLKGIARIVAPVAIVVPLVIVEPDLGTAVFLILGCGIALFVGGWPLKNFAIAGGALIPAAVSLLVLKPYQMRRITGFLAAWNDWEQAPYQLKQSMVSMGAGGFGGVGLGKGWQKLSFLPEANTDFVVAVVGEELGLIGTLALIALWIGFFATGLRVLRSRRNEPFAYAAGTTLLVQLLLQATLNLMVVTGLVPPKGIPHPLISYGGSNLVITIVSIGIILSLSKPSSGWADVLGSDASAQPVRGGMRRADGAVSLAGPHLSPRWNRQPFQGTGPRDLKELRSQEEHDEARSTNDEGMA